MFCKKGEGYDFIVNTIIVLVVFVAIGLVLFYFKTGFSDVAKDAPCSATIYARSRGSDVALNCKHDEIMIDSNKEDEIYEEIAGLMYDCWVMAGEGKLYNIFPTSNGCILCSTFKFDENVKKNREVVAGQTVRYRPYQGFKDYLVKRNVPNPTKNPDKDMSYYDYLNREYDYRAIYKEFKIPFSKVHEESLHLEAIEGRVFPDKEYAIVFLQNNYLLPSVTKAKDLGKKALHIEPEDKELGYSFLYLIPFENIKTLESCNDYMAG